MAFFRGHIAHPADHFPLVRCFQGGDEQIPGVVLLDDSVSPAKQAADIAHFFFSHKILHFPHRYRHMVLNGNGSEHIIDIGKVHVGNLVDITDFHFSHVAAEFLHALVFQQLGASPAGGAHQQNVLLRRSCLLALKGQGESQSNVAGLIVRHLLSALSVQYRGGLKSHGIGQGKFFLNILQ